jgi:hypothetical protein
MTRTLLLVGSSVALFSLACGKVTPLSDAGGDSSSGSADARPGVATLTVAPLTKQFGPVAISATSSAATFTFTNEGAGTATGCSAPTKGGAHPDDFTIVMDNCGTSDLTAGGSCTVTLQARPTVAGMRTTTLSRTCTSGGTASTTADEVAVNRPMYIFITGVSFDGNLGGITGADSICNMLGTNGSASGPLSRTWKALLSKTTGGVVDAKDRFTWTGPMFDLGGKKVTADPSVWPWVNAGEGSNIGVNQNGGGPDDSYVWSGSTEAGVTKGAGFDCNGWTDATNNFSGWSGQTNNFPAKDWIDSFGTTCPSANYGLYCIGE